MSYMGHLGSIPDLNTLIDVTITTPASKQILAYNTLTQRWENQDFQNINASMDSLSDAVISNPQQNQVIMFNSVQNKWVNDYVTHADRQYQFFLSSFN